MKQNLYVKISSIKFNYFFWKKTHSFYLRKTKQIQILMIQMQNESQQADNIQVSRFTLSEQKTNIFEICLDRGLTFAKLSKEKPLD